MTVINKNWKELIKPRKIEFLKDKDNFTNAELVAEPLESGYGQTLGNMLRRVLLSSIRGSCHINKNRGNYTRVFFNPRGH